MVLSYFVNELFTESLFSDILLFSIDVYSILLFWSLCLGVLSTALNLLMKLENDDDTWGFVVDSLPSLQCLEL